MATNRTNQSIIVLRQQTGCVLTTTESAVRTRRWKVHVRRCKLTHIVLSLL